MLTPEARETLNEKLFDLAKKGTAEEIEACIDAGADPNVQTSAGRTPLYLAAAADRAAAVHMLISKGARPSLDDEDGVTPLHIAVNNSAWDAAAALIDDGADKNYQLDKDHVSPLHAAFYMDMRENGVDRVRFMLERGADPEQTIRRKAGEWTIVELARDWMHKDPHAQKILDVINETLEKARTAAEQLETAKAEMLTVTAAQVHAENLQILRGTATDKNRYVL